VLQNLSSTQGDLMLGFRYTDAVFYCHGMSLYFPWQADDYHSWYTDCALFSSSSVWDDLLYLYLTGSAPLTEMFVQGTAGQNGWFTSNAEVSLITYDPTNLGYVTYYELNGTWIEYDGIFQIDQDGTFVISYYSVGSNSAVEIERNRTVMIDRVRPTAEATVNGHLLSLNGFDAVSGVASIHYRIDGGNWILYTGQITVGTAGHMYDVEYYAVDVAGNVGTVLSIGVGDSDDIVPVSSASISGEEGENGWYVSTVSVTLSAEDEGGSGLQGVYYSLDGGAWSAYASPLVISSEGTHVLEYRARDNFGNEEAVRTLNFRIDLHGPAVSIAMDGDAFGEWYSSAVSVTMSSNDSVSGISAISYRVNGGAWAVYNGVISLAMEGTWLLECKAADVAGNEGPVSNVTVRIDTTAPTASAVLSGFNVDGWGGASARCGWSTDDEGSGVAHMYYRFSGGEWNAYVEAIAFDTTGTFVLQFYATDAANNSCAVMNVTCKVDLSAPVTSLMLSGTLYEGNYLNSATVECEIADEGIGGTVLWISLDEGNWTLFDAGMTIGPGEHSLQYYSADALNNSEGSRSISFTVLAASVPGQVIGLNAMVDRGEIRLTWAAPDDGVLSITAFQVYRSADGGEWELLDTVTGTIYVDEEVREGSSYSYRVVAVNLLGEGAASEPATAEVPAAEGMGMTLLVIIAVIVAMALIAAVVLIRRR
jgi:hypothetical protein